MIYGRTIAEDRADYRRDWTNYAFVPNVLEDGRMIWGQWYVFRFVADTEFDHERNWAGTPKDRWIKIPATFAEVQHIRVGLRTKLQTVSVFGIVYAAAVCGFAWLDHLIFHAPGVG